MPRRVKKERISAIPIGITDNELLSYIDNNTINFGYVDIFKRISHVTDSIISDYLSITERTIRNYRNAKEKKALNNNLSEKVVLLISLYKHGEKVFDSANNFNVWLNSENFFFDNKPPSVFLKTVTGIRFIEDRLTGIEHGDNA